MTLRKHQMPLYLGTNAERLSTTLVAEAAGSLWLETDTSDMYVWDGNSWESMGGGGAAAFLDLTDTPASYAGYGSYVLAVNSLEDAIDYVAPQDAGLLALDDLTDVNAPTPNDADVLTYDSGSGDWVAAPSGGAPIIGTAYANAEDAHTNDSTWEDIDSMSVSVTPPFANAKLLCTFTMRIKMDSTNWEHFAMRFNMDAGTLSEAYAQTLDVNATTTRHWVSTVHAVFEGVSAAAHTIKAQWYDNGSSLNVKIYERRLTVMVCQ